MEKEKVPAWYGTHSFGTAKITTDGDIFDLRTTGCAWGRRLLQDPEKYKEEENLQFEFVMMSPEEYYRICAEEV